MSADAEMAHQADESSMTCTACSYVIGSFSDRMQHYKTEWHRYNVKRRCAGLQPITSAAFDLKLTALRNSKPTPVNLKCQACSKAFKTQTAYDQHMQSNKHKKQALKSSAVSTPSIAPPAIESKSIEPATISINGVRQSQERVQTNENGELVLQQEADAEVPVVTGDDAEAKATSDEIEMQPEGPEPKGIPLKHCLFCALDFAEFDLEVCLNHMLRHHGFFIPYVEMLHDIEGLISYLGEKIGIGHMCLYCNGRGRASYPSLHAVQQHMADKSHCKIRLEEDEDYDEFLEFYNFGEEEEEERDVDDESHAKTGRIGVRPGAVVSITDGGELLLANGTLIGHRSLNTFYKQNVRPVQPEAPQLQRPRGITASSSTALIRSLSGEYAVTLTSYTREQKLNEVHKQKFLARAAYHYMRVGVRANKLQHHFRSQIMM